MAEGSGFGESGRRNPHHDILRYENHSTSLKSDNCSALQTNVGNSGLTLIHPSSHSCHFQRARGWGRRLGSVPGPAADILCAWGSPFPLQAWPFGHHHKGLGLTTSKPLPLGAAGPQTGGLGCPSPLTPPHHSSAPKPEERQGETLLWVPWDPMLPQSPADPKGP